MKLLLKEERYKKNRNVISQSFVIRDSKAERLETNVQQNMELGFNNVKGMKYTV